MVERLRFMKNLENQLEENSSILKLKEYISALKNICLELKENVARNEQRLRALEEGQKKIQEQNIELINEFKSRKYTGDMTLTKEQQVNKDFYVLSIWNLEGASDKLVSFLEEWMFSEKTISDKSRLIYLCCLLERGEEELAAVGLRKYYDERGAKLICDYLPLAWLADKIGLGGTVMKKAAFIFSKFEEERKEESFAKYLKEHTFAIVGNSPDIIGSGLGDMIDSRDIVFRMNTYIMNEKYVIDTGKKVNALVDNSNFATIDHMNHQNAGKLKWIYIPYDFWHIQLSQFSNVGKFIESYYNLLTIYNVKITWLFPEESIELKKRLKMISPTSGMAIVYSIYKRMGYISEKWVFGFSKEKKENGKWNNPLKDPGDEEHEELQMTNLDIFSECDELSIFYKDAPCYSRGHNLNREIDLRNELFEEGKLEQKL